MRFTYASGAKPLAGYTIKRGIGAGGFGEVYYATSDAGKEVALKLIRRNLDVELRGVTHCLNLSHPNLVTLHDIRHDSQDDAWVIMEYVSGESLEDAIERHPNGMTIEEALRWFHGIAAGVAYLHDHGIVHRDLKPGNVFSHEQTVKLGDYGLSKFISCSRRSGHTESVGTVHYMAPEIANGRYGKEIDIYALGIILYEIMTGHVPFEGESVGEVLMKHLTAEPNLDRLAEPYRTVVRRALHKDPDQRVASVGEMIAALPAPSTRPNGVFVSPPPPASRQDGPPQDGQPLEAELLEKGPVEDGPLFVGAEPDEMEFGPVIETAELVNDDRSSYDEEPVARAVGEGLHRLCCWWNSDALPGPVKIILQIVGVITLIFTAPYWVSLVVAVMLIYCLYWIARAVILGPSSRRPMQRPRSNRPPPAAANAAASGPRARMPDPNAIEAETTQRTFSSRHHRRRQQRAEQSAASDRAAKLAAKTPREKITELFGSLLLSAVVVAAVSLLMVMMIMPATDIVTSTMQAYVWISLVSLAGSWALLLPAKLWEGQSGEPALRRFLMLLIGLAVGLVAFAVDRIYLVGPRDSHAIPDPFAHTMNFIGQNTLYDAGGLSVSTYLIYFGFLMLILRWWKLADPLRSARVSVWATVVCVFWAYLLSLFWPFPQPWGFMIAATIAIAVQLASAWARPQRRYVAEEV